MFSGDFEDCTLNCFCVHFASKGFSNFLYRLGEIHPKRAEDFHYMLEHLNFIKNLRDLYRLKIAAHNVIGQEYLPPVAESMGYGDDDKAAAQLYDDFMKRTEQAGKVIARLVEGLNK